jgi:hypothetical protein
MTPNPISRARTYMFVVFMIVLGSVGNVLLRVGMRGVGEIKELSLSVLAHLFVAVFGNGWIWLGISSLLLNLACFLLVLTWADYLWNPTAYDAEKSWRRALALLARQGARPVVAGALARRGLSSGVFYGRHHRQTDARVCRYHRYGDPRLGSHPLCHMKGSVEKSMEDEAGGAGLLGHVIRILDLAQDLRFSQDHGIEA